MTKRISCLFLALVMVLLAVPVFALSAFAVEVPYTTAWKDNLPTYGTAEEGYPVDYPNPAWSIGTVARTNYAVFNLFDSDTPGDHMNGLITTENNDPQWTVGGMYVKGSGGRAEQMISTGGYYTVVRYIAEYNGTANATISSLYFSNQEAADRTTAQHGLAIAVNGEIVWPANAAFDADTNWFTGNANENLAAAIDLSALTLELKAGDTVDFVFRRLADAKSSWGPYDFAPSITYSEATEGAPVGRVHNSSYAGDVKIIAPNNKDNGEQPLVYTEWVAAQAEGADTSAAAYGEYFQAFGKITFEGPWTNGVVNPSTGAYELISRRYYFADRKLEAATSWDMNWGVTESYWQAGLKTFLGGTNSSAPWGANAGVMRVDVMACTQPSNNDALYTYAYTAPASGYVSPLYELVATPTAEMRLAILVDGYMVWPTEGGDLATKANFYTVAAETADPTTAINAALKDVSFYVTEGSLVQFVVGKGAWAGSTGTGGSGQGFVIKPVVKLVEDTEENALVIYQDQNGAVVGRFVCKVGDAFPTVEALATWDIDGDGEADVLPATVTGNTTVTAVTFVGRENFAADTPTLNGDKVDFHGDWTVGQGTWSGSDLTAAGLTWTKDGLFTKWDGWAFVGNIGGLWDGNGGGMYSNRRFATKAATNGIGAIYTAPVSGLVDLSFDTLTGVREVGASDSRYETPGALAYYISIVKNGEVIWPTDASAFLLETKTEYTGSGKTVDYLTSDDLVTAIPALPTNIYVNAGDEIAFIANMGNDLSWMFFMDPVVTYTSLVNPPELESGSVALNDKFAANFFIDMDTVPEDATNVGAYINGEFVAAADGKVTVDGIVARKLADRISVAPTYTTASGIEINGKTTEVSPAEMLMQYVTGGTEAEKNLAIATLNYAAAAQTYFNYNTSALANAALTAEQKTVAYTGTYTDGSTVTGTADDKADIYFATLLLKDTVSVKFVWTTTAADFATKYELAVFNGTEIVARMPLTACEGQTTTFKVIAEGLVPTDWNTSVTFAIVEKDGTTVIGQTATYSVMSYFIRMEDSETVGELCKAMIALYEAAAANEA